MAVEGHHVQKVPDVVYHYTTSDRVPGIQARGLWSEGSATNVGTYSSHQAVELLGLKAPPDTVITLKNNGEWVPNKPAIVRPHVLGLGGGMDYTNRRLVPPTCIVCIGKLKQ